MSELSPSIEPAGAARRSDSGRAAPAMLRADRAARRDALLVAILAAIIAFAFQGTRPLWEPDEGRYTNVALRMVESGDWLNPALDEEHLHFSKPPLTYWALAASYLTFGHSEWAVRLPNALAFLATALLVLGIARRLAPRRGLAGALAWTTMVGPVIGANLISTDTLLVLWETLAVFAFVSSGALECRGISSHRILAMWIALALAFLTKGPPGLLPLAGIVAWLAWTRRAREWPGVFSLAGLLAFVIIGGAWYFIVAREHPGLMQYFLRDEVAERLATTAYHRNPGWLGWLKIYGPSLVVGSLPWLALPLIARIRRLLPHEPMLQQPHGWFLLCWLAVPLIVLCLSQSRLPLYVLPLFVPIALLIVRAVPEGFLTIGRTQLAAVGIAAASLVTVKGVGAHIDTDRDGRRMAQELASIVGSRHFQEVVFIGTTPIYSLHHYLGVEVEGAGIDAPGGPKTAFADVESLCSELSNHERFLAMGPASQAQAIQSAADRCPGAGLEELARMRSWVVWARPSER
ncbi:MAG TPA: glycosyltransferase family 39 protein [Steroidobacteraceae bacterium]|nr:glycosyltransferase family 39 protein [Steroidobacteraceae bacterium]